VDCRSALAPKGKKAWLAWIQNTPVRSLRQPGLVVGVILPAALEEQGGQFVLATAEAEGGGAFNGVTLDEAPRRVKNAIPPRCRKLSPIVAFTWILAYENGGRTKGADCGFLRAFLKLVFSKKDHRQIGGRSCGYVPLKGTCGAGQWPRWPKIKN